MQEWGWHDPDELRVRLDLALERVAALEAENERLSTLLRRAGVDPEPAPDRHAGIGTESTQRADAGGVRPLSADGPGAVTAESSAEVKIALFRRLFRGREDVYARRWVSRAGRTGWSPAEADPFNKSIPDSDRTFYPLNDHVIYQHLSRQDGASERDDLHAGLYPMLPDDRCHLVVADFDGKNGEDWRGDAMAFHAACRRHGIAAHLEISRSGAGAHSWIFFDAPVAATTARAMASGLLREAINDRPRMSLDSYDRLFPAQDFLPVNSKGAHRFGNLVALPLHGASRADGRTVFVDPATWEPYDDQFAYLATAGTVSPMRAEELTDELGRVQVGPNPAEPEMPARPRHGKLGKAPAVVPARRAAMLKIETDGLPPQLVAAVKHCASFFNPEFFRNQAQRFSTWNEPRLIRRFDDTVPDRIAVPRGLEDEIGRLVASAGGDLIIVDETPQLPEIEARFIGTLTDQQRHAVDSMSNHDLGVLQAPTGFGKTVAACALIAHHRQKTAIIVNRAELVGQWIERLGQFLDLGEWTVGTLGAGKDRRGHAVDVIMLQSLARRDAPDHLLDGYGLVIVDECHCVGAPAAEAAIRTANVRRWIGLSATPFRADSMDPLITMLLGPIRHTAEDATLLDKHLFVHTTGFDTAESLRDGASIQAMFSELARDGERNVLIADILADAYRRGRRTLALANRVEHLTAINSAVAANGVPSLTLHGGMSSAERAKVRAAMGPQCPGPLVVLAIDKIAGEGLDADFDTLLMMNPVSFKGRVIQQVGRIMRTGPGKTDVEVHDILDQAVPMLERMHHRRRRLLEKRGFTTGTTPTKPVTGTPSGAGPVQHADESQGPTDPTAAQVRAWARTAGLEVTERGRLSAEIRQAYRVAHQTTNSHEPSKIDEREHR